MTTRTDNRNRMPITAATVDAFQGVFGKVQSIHATENGETLSWRHTPFVAGERVLVSFPLWESPDENAKRRKLGLPATMVEYTAVMPA